MVEVRGPAAAPNVASAIGSDVLRAGPVRFTVWVSLMWNAQGLLFSNVPQHLLTAIGELNRRVTAISARLQRTVRPSMVYTAANGTQICPRKFCGASQRPGHDGQGNLDKTVTVQAMDEHLMVYEIESCSSSAELGCPTPPMLLVLDTRVDAATDHPKLARAVLQDHVWGTMPIEGDCAAGFINCAKMVVGNELQLHLRPGDAQLVALTVAR